MFRKLRKPFEDYRRVEATMDGLAVPVQDLPGGHERWVDRSMRWLLDEFGPEPLQQPIYLPAELPGPEFDGTEAAARSLSRVILRRFDVAPDRVDLQLGVLPRTRSATGTALPGGEAAAGGRVPSGLWFRQGDRVTVCISSGLMRDRALLVTVLAQAVGHEALLGSGRVNGARPDLASLTELLAVFYGFGIFLANSSVVLLRHPDGRGKIPVAHGYLRAEALAHALARYRILRGEIRTPSWHRQLDFTMRMRMVGLVRALREPR